MNTPFARVLAVVGVLPVLLRDASLFHALGVAPRDRFSDYEGTFRKVVGSIQFME